MEVKLKIETDYTKLQPLVSVAVVTKTGGLRGGYLTYDGLFHTHDGLNWNPADVLGWVDITPIEDELNNIFHEWQTEE